MLIDTSTLLRTLQVRHPQYETATHALELLPQQGKDLHIVPQNLVELWVVATRPAEQNGLGMTPSAVAAELTRLKSMFELLPETRQSIRHGKLWSLSTQYRGSRLMMRGW